MKDLTPAHILGLSPSTSITLNDDNTITWIGKADIDGDGTGVSHGDPDFQPDTSLHFNGRALNADLIPYIVVPRWLAADVPGIVLGCQAVVLLGSKLVQAVVGDIGPDHKIGEVSIECARRLGIPASPLTGGVAGGVFYRIHPGIPAIVDGIQYALQPLRG